MLKEKLKFLGVRIMKIIIFFWGWNFLFNICRLVDAEGCKDMTFKDTFKGKALKNHVIKTERATDDGHCESMCFMDDRCIAYSFGKDKDNQNHMCELSESDHVMHPEDLVDRQDTVYRRAQNNCKCPKQQICRANFVDNTHRCECKAGFTGQQCDIEIQPCDSSPCLNAATCTNKVDGTFQCSCPAGFTGILCQTRYYYMDHNDRTWDAAKDFCKSKGGKLPSIHSAEENSKVLELQKIIHHWMWIGLYSPKDDGAFVWSDGTPVNYTNWEDSALRYPNYYSRVHMVTETGKWARSLQTHPRRTVCLFN